MTEEELNRARIFYMSAGSILPLLEEMQTNSMYKLLNTYKRGETNVVGPTAELSAITDLIDEIKTKLNIYETKLKEQK